MKLYGQFRFTFQFITRTHCYFTKLNLKKMGPLQFCLPALLEIHRSHKQKEFLKFCEGFLRYSNLSSQISTWSWTEPETFFLIKSKNGTLITPQMKSFGTKKIQIPCTDQKVPFWQLFKKGRDGRALLVGPSRIPHRISKIFFVYVSYEFLVILEGRIRETPFV